MKKILLLSALFVLNTVIGRSQTMSATQPADSSWGLVFSDGSTVKGELYPDYGQDTAYVILDQVLSPDKSFRLYDFATQTAWTSPLSTFSCEHVSLQNGVYVADSTAEYDVAIMRDSLIIVLHGDVPESSAFGGKRGGSALYNGREFIVDGYHYIIWKDYTYYINDKDVTIKIPGQIAIVTFFSRDDNSAFCPPEKVTVNGVTYPVAVIAENFHIPNHHRHHEIRIKPWIKCIEYFALVTFEYQGANRFIVEDSEEPLLLGPSRETFCKYSGGLYRLKVLDYCYIGRNIINCKPDYNPRYGPLCNWESAAHMSVVWGPYVTNPGHHFFYNAPVDRITSVTVEALNPPTIDYDIFGIPPSDINKPTAKVLAGLRPIYTDEHHKNWNANFKIEAQPDAGGCGGTKWQLVTMKKMKDKQVEVLGYKLDITDAGYLTPKGKKQGKMDDLKNASDYGWYPERRYIKEVIIENGVTYVGKNAFRDCNSVEAIHIGSRTYALLPTFGTDAFLNVNKKTPVYIYSKVRDELKTKGHKDTELNKFTDFRDSDIGEYKEKFKNWMDSITPMDGQSTEAIKRLKADYQRRANSLFIYENIETLKPLFIKALFGNAEDDGTFTRPYSISNAAQFVCFAKLTHLPEYSAICGKLTADLNVSNYGRDGVVGPSKDCPYAGTFDGNGHRIAIALADAEAVGLFGYLTGTVKNLTVAGDTYLVGVANFAGGIVACCMSNARLLNCISENDLVVAPGVSNAGGLIGKVIDKPGGSSTDSVLVENCAFVGSIRSSQLRRPVSNCAGLVGGISQKCVLKNCYTHAAYADLEGSTCYSLARSNDARKGIITITNCYCVEDIGGMVEQGEFIEDTTVLASGELCYRLNNEKSDGAQGWFQYLYDDHHDRRPHPFSYGNDVVFKDNQTNRYFNQHNHDFSTGTGFCTLCGAVEPNKNEYKVSTAGQWKNLAAYVDKDHNNFKIILECDIDLSSIGNAAMVGKKEIANAFKGHFDGQGHTLTVNIESSEDRIGLFRGTHHATIKNVEVTGNITSSDLYIGGIVGDGFWETKMENCISEVNITYTKEGVCGSGGLIGICNGPLIINNCAFVGKMIGRNDKTSHWGGLVGWVCSGTPTITNSYVYATMDNTSKEGCSTFARIYMDQDQNIRDCYFVNPLGNTQRGKQVKESEVKSGYLCYEQLNNGVTDGTQIWYQKLNEEDFPFPSSQGNDTVFLSGPNTYSNVRHTHTFGPDGFCTICSAINPEAKSFTISTPLQMCRWVYFVNTGHGDVNAQLTIDLDDRKMPKPFAIGSHITYTGTFDGQGHKVILNFGNVSTAPVWANFAGTLRNTYFVQCFSNVMEGKVADNNFALIGNCKTAQIENCVFRLTWSISRSDRKKVCRLGGLINTIDGQVRFNNCAFLGKISPSGFIGRYFNELSCLKLFILNVNSNQFTASNCYEYIFFKPVNLLDYIWFSSFLSLSGAFTPNCYRYDSQTMWDKVLPSELVDNLNGRQSPLVWKRMDNQDVFETIPVPFAQCGINWNGYDGAEMGEALLQTHAPAPEQRAIKYVKDGHIVIRNGNRYYDIFGREL